MSSEPVFRGVGDQRTDANVDNSLDDAIDLRDLFFRIVRGLPQIAAFALLGFVIAVVGAILAGRLQTATTSTRVVFTFPGFEREQYPDGSKFQPDDLRAPDVVAEAIKRRGFDPSPEFQSKIRAALSVQASIPPNIVKERDRLRASGQTPPVYIPDEYTVSLTVPRGFSLSPTLREQLLGEIVTAVRENFRRTYADTPLNFGNAFEILRDADFPDYEAVFDQEMQGVTSYLVQLAAEAKLYRSPTTNFTFSDLLKQTQMFAQIRLNETIGLIRENGLSQNRRIALVKMNDALRILNDDERRAMDEESVVRELLGQAQNREQNYVLGVKNQAGQARSGAPLLDQGVIDSLLANDSYGFLVRKALDAGLKVKQVQADKTLLLERIENMKAFTLETIGDQSAIIAEVEKSVERLEAAYQQLIASIRKTHADFQRQRYGDAIRVSDEARTTGTGVRPLLAPAAVGLFLGVALGAGLSLLGVYVRPARPNAH